MKALKPQGWQKEILNSPPFLIPPDPRQQQKDKTLHSPNLHVSFSYTKNQKKNSSFW